MILKQFTFLSCILIILLNVFDTGRLLLDGYECILYFNYPRENIEFNNFINSAYQICALGFIYKWIGLIISFFGLLTFIFPSLAHKNLQFFIICFSVLTLIFSLPIYHNHGGLGNYHGHSFWDGGSHFH